MAYTPENNPYIPGDPYSYDLKWMVSEIDKWKLAEEDLDHVTEEADRAKDEADRAKDEADRAADKAVDAADSANAAAASESNAKDYADHIADPISGIVTGWLDANVDPVGSAVTIDESLLINGSAADAQVTGAFSVMASHLSESGIHVYDKIEDGGWSYGTKVVASNRIRSATLIPVTSGAKINIASPSLKFYIGIVSNLGAVSYIENFGWITPGTSGATVSPSSEGYAVIIIGNTSDTAITTSDYDGTITIESVTTDIISDISEIKQFIGYNVVREFNENNFVDIPIEQNGWVYGTKLANAFRLSSKYAYKLRALNCISVSAGADNNVVICMLDDMTSTSWTTETVSPGTNKIVDLPADKYVVINISKSVPTQVIDPSEYDSVISIFTDRGKIPGKNVHIYHFGGDGNDYCFVRTPVNYDPERVVPYPFVICNHGNGWVMNGTEEKANWTKKTMYVPLTDPDYLNDPTNYNGTADSTLWYSNPTIEALLSAGYIVCGAENYGDALYGNENCRQGCVDFYSHMVKNYNVPDSCFMIGASNGAQTSINAAYLLGKKVKAMILQYPLTCLINQYLNYPPHQADIRVAYGITNPSPTEQDLIDATLTHDFLHTDIIADAKIGYFPPVSLYYSYSDSVVDPSDNSLPMIQALANGLKIAIGNVCTGDHGDHSHFDPAAYLAFFETFNKLASA